MSLLIANDDKELARLNELERQLKLKKEKMSIERKKLNQTNSQK